MKSPTVLLLLAASSAIAQGTFQNLDFESAVVPTLPSDQAAVIPFTNAFPGWLGYVGTNQLPIAVALYNGYSLGSAVDSLIDGHTTVYSNDVISGNYTAVLQAGNVAPPLLYGSAAIAQTGVIPAEARSLTFAAFGAVSDMAFTLNGQTIAFVPVATGPNSVTYGANISAFAGQMAEIRFTSRPISYAFASVFLDNIQFSPSTIPEPNVLTLSALGTLLLTWRFLRQTRNS